ncbi:G-D-S-L family lipolytic protein [Amycolatopsis acidicola]|uniref:G-D-S-L family lipolytic protein n=1 Tax=Amycolatopsis acidicola TaxID=2596893 RepID=A0A5N0VM02_9PSEU|nr:GDSL-type esterase/lipase family protein [Amycolatopsis acidicola]KAA9166344.1 G-D-S-L family lipolytic protein [Amycolatopsis acidicola]
MTLDLRVCFLGDSFVAGVGDPEYRGWAGRVAARTGQPLTCYNLGVRRETSEDVRARWRAECAPRLRGEVNALVLSFGVNDTLQGLPPETTVANLVAMLGEWPTLVVGPPPIADDEQNRRIAALGQALRAACAERTTPYVDVFGPLRDTKSWMREVEAGDGAHPAADGYAAYAELVHPQWTTWLASLSPH